MLDTGWSMRLSELGKPPGHCLNFAIIRLKSITTPTHQADFVLSKSINVNNKKVLLMTGASKRLGLALVQKLFRTNSLLQPSRSVDASKKQRISLRNKKYGENEIVRTFAFLTIAVPLPKQRGHKKQAVKQKKALAMPGLQAHNTY
jgi:hypothetical protein